MLFRLFRTTLEQCLLGLIRLEQQGEESRSIIRAVANSPYSSQPVVHAALDSPDIGSRSLHDAIDELKAVLQGTGIDQNEDVTLIDSLVKILQLPFGRGRITDQTIKDLRRALLIPSELAGLNAQLIMKETRCTNCSRTFTPGEMTAIYPNRMEGVAVYCHNCVRPELIACSTAGCPNAYSSSKHKPGTRGYCAEHNTTRPDHIEPPNQAPENPRLYHSALSAPNWGAATGTWTSASGIVGFSTPETSNAFLDELLDEEPEMDDDDDDEDEPRRRE